MSDTTTTTTTTSAPAARVPQLTGVPANEAHDRALDAGVLAVAENAFHTGAGRAHVGRQEPEAGTPVEKGSIVRIWISSD
jgi:beta-lactam-binding protein with PASTA domain